MTVEKKYHISYFRKVVFLLIGIAIIGFAVSPNSMAYPSKTDTEINTPNAQDAENNGEVQEYFKAYEAIVPASQMHLVHDFIYEFIPFIIEEQEFESDIEIPFFVNNHRKILFSRIISPNAP